MPVPMCPVHSSPMRLGKGGGYFCPRKMPDDTFCTEKVAPPKGQPATAAPQVVNGAAPSPRQLLVIAALDFASRVFQSSNDGDGALTLANLVISNFGGEK